MAKRRRRILVQMEREYGEDGVSFTNAFTVITGTIDNPTAETSDDKRIREVRVREENIPDWNGSATADAIMNNANTLLTQEFTG